MRSQQYRIAIDTSPLYVAPAGIARGINGIFTGFKECDTQELDIRPFAWEVHNLDYRQPARMLKTLYREVFWASIIAPGKLKSNQIDLLHSPGIPIIRTPIKGIKHIVSLNDLAVVRHPERFRRWHLHISKVGMKRTMLADKVMCISQSTADEAIRLTDIDPKKLVVVHLASDWDADNLPRLERPVFEIPDEYFLFVGTLEPGKNLQLLIDVYRLAEERGIQLPPLVIVGVRREGVQKESSLYNKDQFIFSGRIPDAQLAWLYNNAQALLFPSKYEGFGIPLIEAMTLDCPIICSNVTSLGEVGGEAPIYTELTPDKFLSSITELLNNDSMRNEAIEAGREQSRKFSWKKTAAETIEVYKAVLGS